MDGNMIVTGTGGPMQRGDDKAQFVTTRSAFITELEEMKRTYSLRESLGLMKKNSYTIEYRLNGDIHFEFRYEVGPPLIGKAVLNPPIKTW